MDQLALKGLRLSMRQRKRVSRTPVRDDYNCDLSLPDSSQIEHRRQNVFLTTAVVAVGAYLGFRFAHYVKQLHENEMFFSAIQVKHVLNERTSCVEFTRRAYCRFYAPCSCLPRLERCKKRYNISWSQFMVVWSMPIHMLITVEGFIFFYRVLSFSVLFLLLDF